MSFDPVFRSADEVIVDSSKLKGLCGWTDGSVDEDTAVDQEKGAADRLMADMPAAFNAYGDNRTILPEIDTKWQAFQLSKGRYKGSCDWSILDEFVTGKPMDWEPQIIGSCVMSNTNPVYVIRNMYQLTMLGESGTYYGRNETGPDNYAIYGPMSYGMARKRANMRGGDGLYCEPMLESLMKDGVLPCNDPDLLTLMDRLGFTNPTDFPEPQGNDGASLYRDFGKWKHLESLQTGLTGRVLKGRYIKNIDQLLGALEKCEPCFVCSMEAIHKVGTHKDGFAIHARNYRDSWAHNMNFQGFFIASDGEVIVRHGNTSWGPQHMYNRRAEEVDKALRTGKLTVASIQDLELKRATAPTA